MCTVDTELFPREYGEEIEPIRHPKKYCQSCCGTLREVAMLEKSGTLDELLVCRIRAIIGLTAKQMSTKMEISLGLNNTILEEIMADDAQAQWLPMEPSSTGTEL